MFGAIALLSALDRANPKRWANALFWGLFATSFLAGDYLGDLGNGVLVLAMVAHRRASSASASGEPATTITTSAARSRSATATSCSWPRSRFPP